MTPDEWVAMMRRNAAVAAQIERDAIRSGVNAVSFMRRSPLESRVQAAGNRMRVTGRVDTRRVADALVAGVSESLDKAWS